MIKTAYECNADKEYKRKKSSQLQLQIKPREKFWGSNGIQTHNRRDTGVMLYQLSYEASLEAGQVPVQFIPVIWRVWHDVYIIKIIWAARIAFSCILLCLIISLSFKIYIYIYLTTCLCSPANLISFGANSERLRQLTYQPRPRQWYQNCGEASWIRYDWEKQNTNQI